VVEPVGRGAGHGRGGGFDPVQRRAQRDDSSLAFAERRTHERTVEERGELDELRGQ
jgi:hypothetical protein